MKAVAQILSGEIHPLALQPFFQGVFQQNLPEAVLQVLKLTAVKLPDRRYVPRSSEGLGLDANS